MATEVASLFATLRLDNSQFRNEMSRSQSGLRDLGTTMQSVGGQVAGIGAQMTAFSAPAALAAGAAVRSFMSFDATLTEISARTGTVGADLEMIGDTAKQMGADTVFSSQQVLDAFLDLTTSGASVAEAMETLDEVTDLAAAGNIELGQSADLVTDVMAMFQMELEDSRDVVDALVSAAGSSSANVDQLGDALTNVGPIAAQMGLDVEDTAAILALFAENGVKGSAAGTQLKSMLLNMTRNAEGVPNMWKSLNIELYDAEGNMRDVNTIFEEMNTVMADMPTEEQNAALQKLFGSYGIIGGQILTTSAGFEGMAETMRGQASAATVAEQQMASLSNRFASLMGSVETLGITLVDLVDEHLANLVQRGISAVNTMTAFADANPQLTTTLIAVGAALTLLGPALVSLGGAMMLAGVAVGGLTTAFTVLMGPVGLAMAAGVALTTAYVTNFGGMRDFVDGQVRPVLMGFFNLLGGVWERVRPALDSLAGWFTVGALPGIVGYLAGAVKQELQFFGNLVSGLWSLVQPGLTALAGWFTTTGLPSSMAFLTGTAMPALRTYANFLTGLWAVVQSSLSSLRNWFVVTGLPAAARYVRDTAMPILESFGNWLRNLWSNISGPLREWRDGIVSFFGEAIQKIEDFLNQWNIVSNATSGFQGLVGIGELVNSGQVTPGQVGGAIASEFRNSRVGGFLGGGNTSTTNSTENNTTINVTQQPGESGEQLADRIVNLQRSRG